VEREGTFVAQRENREGGERLRDGADAVERVGVGANASLHVGEAESLKVGEVSVDDDPEHEARKPLLLEPAGGGGVHVGERGLELLPPVGIDEDEGRFFGDKNLLLGAPRRRTRQFGPSRAATGGEEKCEGGKYPKRWHDVPLSRIRLDAAARTERSCCGVLE